MVSQYSVISDPFTAPTKAATNKQASTRQDASASSFESHLRNEDRREAARLRDERQSDRIPSRRADYRASNDDNASRSTARDSQRTDDSTRTGNGADPRPSARADDNVTRDASSQPADTKPAPRADGPADRAPSAKAEPSDKPDRATQTATADAGSAQTSSGTSETDRTDSALPAMLLAAQSFKDQSQDDQQLDAQAAGALDGEPLPSAPEGLSDLLPELLPEPFAGAVADAGTEQETNAAAGQPTNNGANSAQSSAIAQQQKGQARPMAPHLAQPDATLEGTPQQPAETDLDADQLAAKATDGNLVQTGAAETAPADAPEQAQTQTPAQVPAQVSEQATDQANAGGAIPAASQQAKAGLVEIVTSQTEQAPSLDADPVTQSVSSHQPAPQPPVADTAPQQADDAAGETSDDTATATRADGQTETASETADQPTSQKPMQPIALDLPPQTSHLAAQSDAAASADADDQLARATMPANGQAHNQATTHANAQATTPDQQQNQTQAALAALAQGKDRAEQGMKEAQQAAASNDNTSSDASDAGDEPASPKAVNPLTVAAATETTGALRQAPKADAFSKMMSGIANQGGLKDAAMQSDPTLKVDGLPAMQGDGTTVRLTGMESFARTGHVPQQAAAANAQAMAAQISKFAMRGETRFEIRLDPADLGKVDVRLTIGSDGQTRAHLFVERPETLDMFMRDQRMMERSLLQSGLNLDKQGLEFSLMDQQSGGQQMAQDQREAMEQDSFGSNAKAQTNSEEQTTKPLIQPAQSGTYVASTGVNLVI